MDATVKLYSYSLRQQKTYLIALTFVVANLALPQLCHLLHMGGPIFLPLFFLTLIAAYKYGLSVGLLTAILSPLTNWMLFGMPPAPILPEMIMKSILFAMAASFLAAKSRKVSFVCILGAILFYQTTGTLIEWAVGADISVLLSSLRIAIPGLLIQLFGGYLVLKALSRF